MNERKVQKLLSLARTEPAPAAPPGFDSRVRRALHREERPESGSFFDQLGELCPRLALAAALVVGLCVAADVCLSKVAQMDLSAAVTEASEQWLFAVR